MTFQNIRNLGANGNQPLITNQNDFQIFDNVTWIKGRHTLKAGGSVTFRSREILNADSIVGVFNFNNNMTSNCAGLPAGCRSTRTRALTSRASCSATSTRRTATCSTPETYTEKRPEFAIYLQDDWRASSEADPERGPALGRLPAVDRGRRGQSNFDESTGKFVVASDNAVIDGVEVGRYLQTYSKGDFAPRVGFAYDLGGNGRTVVRGGFGVFWNFTPGGTSSSKAQNPPFLQATALTPTPTAYGTNLLLKDGLPLPPGVDPNRPAAGNTRSIFDINFRDAFARQWNVNVQRAARHELHGGGRLRRVAGPADDPEGRIRIRRRRSWA